MRTIIAIAIAGAIGALARFGISTLFLQRFGDRFPWGTIVINVTGAFAIGLLFGIFGQRVGGAVWLRTALVVGFLGAYTTFSAFSLETVRLFEDGAFGLGIANAAGSVVAGLVAVYVGILLGRAVA